tara:strand:+ start:630 stop:1703 length:1074 start_codon:yes stop_codon:yes gene_type:complete
MKSKKGLNEKFISFLDQIDDSHKNDKLNLNDKVLIIDGLNTFIRSFSVNPAINEDGVHIGGIAGFLKSIRYTLSVIKPTRCIIVFDGKDGSKRRRKIYPEYKAQRKIKKRLNRNVDWGTAPANEEESMKLQLGRLVEYLEYLPLTLVSVDGIEADDTMAYISKQFLSDSKIVLMSTDKDFLQLVDDRISVWSPTKKILYTPDKVKDEYGIPSKNLLTYRILDGDKSDNINGVQGAGLKSIIKYIPSITEDDEFNAKNLLDFVESSDSKIKLLENIKNSSNLIKRNYLLMQLSKVDIPNHTKRKITDSIRRDIPELVKYKLQTMIMKDKLYSNISDFGSWVKEFLRLNHLKGLNRDGE